jgi:hypothetical protein
VDTLFCLHVVLKTFLRRAGRPRRGHDILLTGSDMYETIPFPPRRRPAPAVDTLFCLHVVLKTLGFCLPVRILWYNSVPCRNVQYGRIPFVAGLSMYGTIVTSSLL